MCIRDRYYRCKINSLNLEPEKTFWYHAVWINGVTYFYESKEPCNYKIPFNNAKIVKDKSHNTSKLKPIERSMWDSIISQLLREKVITVDNLY